MKELTVLEQIILAAILSLKDDAYGVSVRKKVKKLTGKSIMYGTLYNALDQMFRKGYVTKRKSSSESGRNNRIYYALTCQGKKSLQAAYMLQKSIWTSIPEFIRNNEV